jgi:hypothetical protein
MVLTTVAPAIVRKAPRDPSDSTDSSAKRKS